MKKIHFAILTLTFGFFSAFAQDEAVSKNYMGVAWSPDGKSLSFTILEMKTTPPRSMKAAVYVMKADGSGMRKITGEGINAFGPAWSKDGARIFFGGVNPETKEAQIYSVGADGNGLTQLTRTGRNSSPVVSPDGKKIVFNSETVEHKPQIWVMNIDGSDAKALTNDTALAFYNPIWSPDGKRIVYYTEKGDNKDQIWTMNADGGDQKLLTGNIGHNFYPAWSADGKRIIFCSDRDGEKEVIYSMKTDGSDVKRLLKTNSFYAKFSPDGKRIAFIAGKFPANNIFIAGADGSKITKLTNQ